MNIFPLEIQSNMFVTKLSRVYPAGENMTYWVYHVKALAVEKLQNSLHKKPWASPVPETAGSSQFQNWATEDTAEPNSKDDGMASLWKLKKR